MPQSQRAPLPPFRLLGARSCAHNPASTLWQRVPTAAPPSGSAKILARAARCVGTSALHTVSTTPRPQQQSPKRIAAAVSLTATSSVLRKTRVPGSAAVPSVSVPARRDPGDRCAPQGSCALSRERSRSRPREDSCALRICILASAASAKPRAASATRRGATRRARGCASPLAGDATAAERAADGFSRMEPWHDHARDACRYESLCMKRIPLRNLEGRQRPGTPAPSGPGHTRPRSP